MKVVKRDGRLENVSFDKIITRIRFLCEGTTKNGNRLGEKLEIDPIKIAQKVIQEIRDHITTRELDEFAASTSASLSLEYPDYSELAARIIISNHHKNTLSSFSDTMKLLYENKDIHQNPSPLIDRKTYKIIINNQELLDAKIDYLRDYQFDYFGFKTLEKSYLIKYRTGQFLVQERPQHLFMRVAIGIHGDNLEAALETYNHMSMGLFIHATPTLFNCGTPRPQLSSCFLLGIDDSIEGIYKCISDCAKISKWAGGIGVHMSNIRAVNSIIRGTNGKSNGIIPMLRVFNETARYVDQGGGKRMGSFAIYLEPWHAEFMEFLELKKNSGVEHRRARDLFYAVYMPDLFMKRLRHAIKLQEENTEEVVYWSVMCPDECPGLNDTYGEEFEKLYQTYETQGKARAQYDILTIWQAILTAQKETGTPYILYKDHINRKSNQKNVGVIKSSNLCCEIVEYSDQNEYAVCNLSSVALPKHMGRDEQGQPFFDHSKLFKTIQIMTRNLNKIIDINYYPVPEARKSNLRHRPIGVGVQGFADLLILMRYPFDSPETMQLNKDIFETIYYAALNVSVELAKENGPYETFAGSPASQGLLQYDLWNQTPSDRWNWKELKEQISKYGLRNSLLVAPMPTASTGQILGNNEAFEPYTYNVYVRRVLAGEYTIVNKHLQKDLVALNLWTPEMQKQLIAHRGSVQKIAEIPEDLKKLYKTSFEIKQKVLIDLAAARGPFIDQSQSLNLFLSNPDDDTLTSMHLYSWEKGLKTGIYYLRREPIKHAQQFTVVPSKKSSSEIPSASAGPTGLAESPTNSQSSVLGEGLASDQNQDLPTKSNLCLLKDPDCLACQ